MGLASSSSGRPTGLACSSGRPTGLASAAPGKPMRLCSSATSSARRLVDDGGDDGCGDDDDDDDDMMQRQAGKVMKLWPDASASPVMPWNFLTG